MIRICPIPPMGKPRMTQRDKWMKRDCVVRYHAFADALRLCFKGVELPRVCSLLVDAYFPMPESWNERKRADMRGKPHTIRPDADNVLKAVQDALFLNDAGIHSVAVYKCWDDGNGARIEIEWEE